MGSVGRNELKDNQSQFFPCARADRRRPVPRLADLVCAPAVWLGRLARRYVKGGTLCDRTEGVRLFEGV